MQMRHFLMAVRTCIGEQAITACHKPRITGHLAHGADKTGDFGIRSLSGKVIPTDIRALGNDQDMRWGLRIDVVEGKGEFILINLPAGNFAAQHLRSEEHTSELQSLMRISYAVFCLTNKTSDKQ